jgi:hypothetical protein
MATWTINPAGGADFTTLALALASGSTGSGDRFEFAAGDHACVGTSHTKSNLTYAPLVDGQTWALKRVTGTGPVILAYTGFVLDGGSGFVTVTGGTDYGIAGNGTSRTMTLNNVILTGNAIGAYRLATGSTLNRCIVDNNTGKGVSVVSGQTATANACAFWANGDDGFTGAGCAVNRSAFYGNNSGTIGVAQCNLSTTGTATECIAEGGALLGIKANVAVRCSSTNNATGNYSVTTNTTPLTGPVSWTNPVAGDFTISETSPAWHAGQPSAVTVDLAGATYDATAPSIGPFEFIPALIEGVPPTGPVVEAWLWAGSDATSTIEISEDGVTFYPFAISASLPLREAMAAWETAINASGDLTGSYALVWDAPANQVTIDRAGGTFALRFPGCVGLYLGFAEASYAAAGLHTSDTTPQGLATLTAYGCEVVSTVGESRLREFRHGRALAIALAYAYTMKAELVLSPEQARLFEAGPMFHSKIRLTPLGATTAYTLDDAGGYLDLEVYDSELSSEGFLAIARLDCQWSPT